MTKKLLDRGRQKLAAQNPLNRHLKEKQQVPKPMNWNPWKPLPGPQTAAFESEADELFYGGASGGGKTSLLLMLAIHSHEHSAIFRRCYPELKEVISTSKELLSSVARYNSTDKLWRDIPGGKTLEFGAIQHEHDKNNWRGRAHDLKAFDEITSFTESQFRFISAWNRTTTPGQRCRVVCTGNPPSSREGEWILHYWCPWLDPKHPNPAEPGELRWFAVIDGKDVEVDSGEPLQYKGELIKPRSRTFIPAKLADNPYLEKTGYRSTLQGLPEPLRSQLLYGDFSIKVNDDAWSIIPKSWLEQARLRYDADPRKWDMEALQYGWRVGVDVGDGVDRHAISLWRGNVLYQVRTYETQNDREDTMRLADEVERTARRLENARIAIDRIGVGAGVLATLIRKGIEAEGCVFGEAARDKSQFRDRKIELYWAFREGLRLGEIAIAPLGEFEKDIFEEFRSIRYNSSADRQLFCEPKTETRKRLKRSPDAADSSVIALSLPLPRIIHEPIVYIADSSDPYEGHYRDASSELYFGSDPTLSEVNKWFDVQS
jgi:hypothetical protein